MGRDAVIGKHDVAVLTAADQQHLLIPQDPAGADVEAGKNPQNQLRGGLGSHGFFFCPDRSCPGLPRRLRRSGDLVWIGDDVVDHWNFSLHA